MQNYDFGIFDRSGRLKAVVEAKRRFGMEASWAREFRRNLAAHGAPTSEFFVFVTPDRIFTWRSGAPTDAVPDADIDARPIFAPYFERSQTKPEQIEPSAFETLVAWWLDDVVHTRTTDPRLRESGLLDTVSGGQVRREIAA